MLSPKKPITNLTTTGQPRPEEQHAVAYLISSNNTEEIQTWIKDLANLDSRKRREAAEMLQQLKATEAVGPLSKALQEERHHLTLFAMLEAIGELATPDVLPSLQSFCASSSMLVQNAAKKSVRRIRDRYSNRETVPQPDNPDLCDAEIDEDTRPAAHTEKSDVISKEGGAESAANDSLFSNQSRFRPFVSRAQTKKQKANAAPDASLCSQKLNTCPKQTSDAISTHDRKRLKAVRQKYVSISSQTTGTINTGNSAKPEKISEDAKHRTEGIDLVDIEKFAPGRAASPIRRIADAVEEWLTELDAGGVDNRSLIQTLRYADETLRGKLETFSAYGKENVANSDEDYQFISKFVKDRLLNSISRFVSFEQPPKHLGLILQHAGFEIIPIVIGETEADARFHNIQNSRQTNKKAGTIIEVILPGLQRKSDGNIVQKPVVIRGE